MPHQRRYMEWLGHQIGVFTVEGWYTAVPQQLLSLDDSCVGLIRRMYEGSIKDALVKVFSDVKWKVWRFLRTPNEYPCCWMIASDPKTFKVGLSHCKALGLHRKPTQILHMVGPPLQCHGTGRLVQSQYHRCTQTWWCQCDQHTLW